MGPDNFLREIESCRAEKQRLLVYNLTSTLNSDHTFGLKTLTKLIRDKFAIITKQLGPVLNLNLNIMHPSKLTTHCTLAAYSVRTQNRLKIYAFFTLKTIFGKKFQRLKKEKRLRLIKLQGLINNRGDWT